MLRNYLLIGLRNLQKHFTYSIINVTGLGLGIATCLLLMTWIRHELNYDRFHANADRLYRASLEYSFGGQTSKTNVSPTALLPVVQKNFAEVENGVRIYNPSQFSPFVVRKESKLFQEKEFYYGDSSFFQIFSFPLLQGDPRHVLTAPRSVVLTRSMARKYFDQEDPVGKILQINNQDDYTVTGVMADPPSNTLFQFDFIASFSSLDAARQQIWWSANYETYFLLTPQADVRSLEEKTNALVRKELKSELTNANDYVKYNFMPLTDIYLHSDVAEWVAVSSISYVYGFGAIALIILAIACINYINLATARGADRAKEVGIRKVVGAVRGQLFFQFIGESAVITFLAFLLAFITASVTLPLFNLLTGKYFTAGMFVEPSFLAACAIALLGIAFIAGAYPALAITSFRPVSVLKGNFKTSGRGLWLRQSLVVFQFCVSIILIVGTLVILKQLRYLQSTRLGYENENVILLPLDRKTNELYAQLRSEFLRTGKVAQVARATEAPTQIRGGYSISVEGAGIGQGMIVTAMTVDSTFIPALGMQIVAGRNFTSADFRRNQSDTTVSFVLNQSAIRELMLDPDKAIGTQVNLNGRKGEIVGILQDFHFASLHSAIGPLVLFNEEAQYHALFVKLQPGNVGDAITALKSVCSKLLPHRPFEYEFLDQKYEALYQGERRMGTISTAFASLAILIACLGLFGLVAFAAAQKRKEIGIRKVMGATATHVVLLITRDYVRLVLAALVIGLPASYWIVEKLFLGEFTYRTSIGAWPLVSAALACLFISFATASYQAIKAAWVNPTETLRNE